MDQSIERKKVIIHIGFRKTGTTTIQRLLSSVPSENRSGVFISSRDELTEKWRRTVMHNLHYRTGREKVSREIQKVAAKLRARPEPTILISDENLFANRVIEASLLYQPPP